MFEPVGSQISLKGSAMQCNKAVFDASFEVLDERREKMAALAHGALTLLREHRDRQPPSDSELIMEILLDLIERKDDIRQTQEGVYRAAGLQGWEG
ncbi:hypothetical protein [Hydrogenophaga intermedia]|nr:hypothetical protein [Hydrogenophaga intermedia]TMU76346.1 hypothetical protein FGJ01_06430 [Hydrogenophaga intermedia]